MTRIEQRFQQLASDGKKGFIPYICAGDPSIQDTEDIVLRLEDAGADIIEIGIPFSDPLADGPANQRAAERALEAGTRLEHVFEAVSNIRQRSEVPIVLFTYINPLYALGFENAADKAASAGADGILLVDLSLEESAPFSATLKDRDLNHIQLITVTSSDERIKKISEHSTGFVYCVSRAGVTGEQSEIQTEATGLLERAHAQTDLPIALGFGISNPEQARAYAELTEAVVVGSFIVNTLHNHPRDQAIAKIKTLIDAVKEV